MSADVLAAYGPAKLPPRLSGLVDDPAELRDRVADEFGRYWSLAIAPHWPHIRAKLEADVLHRGQQLAYRGPATTFGGLHPLIRWHRSALAVDIIRQWRREVPVAGRGLRLVPSCFTPWPQLPIDIDDPPVLGYPARAQRCCGMSRGQHRPRSSGHCSARRAPGCSASLANPRPPPNWLGGSA